MKRISVVILLSLLSYADVSLATENPSKAITTDTKTKKISEKAAVVETGKQGDPTATQEATESPITGNVAMTSNYMWRGVSLSDNLPAVQGGLTYTFLKTGIYLNLWGSNVKFPDINGNSATVEFDTVAGIANEVGEHFSYDISVARYNYPGARGVNYNELLTRWAFYILTAELDYSANVFNTHSSGTYYNLGFNYDIPSKYIFNVSDVAIKGGVGHFSLPRSAGLSSYNDYLLQIGKTWGMYNLALLWTGTNGRSVDEPAIKANHITATLTANF